MSEFEDINTDKIDFRTDYEFWNWSKTFSCRPECYFRPKNEEQIIQILNKAVTYNRKLKVVGCGQSPSDISCTYDYMVDTRSLNNLISVNKEKLQVTVEAGATLRLLNEVILPEHGLALSVAGSISDITVGGAISTGTHGTGLNYGCLASYVTELDVILANGQKLHCSRSDDPEMFLSCCCGLGAVGIVVNVTLQCEPAFRLEQSNQPERLDDVLKDLDTYLNSSDHFRFMWYPHTEHVVTSFVSRTTKTMFKPSIRKRIVDWFWNYLIGYYLLELCYWFSAIKPSLLVPLVNKLFFYFVYSRPAHFIDDGYKVFNFECLFKQYVNEWAIPREKCSAVLSELKKWTESESGAYAHFPVEVRFVRRDDIYLTPTSGRDTCYINILMYRPYNNVKQNPLYWNKFEEVVKSVGGRPHWAKAHRETSIYFQHAYPNWSKWCEVRKRADPNGLFLNNFLERVLDKFL